MKTTPDPLENEAAEFSSLPNTMTCDFIRTLIENYRKNQMVSVKDKLGIDDAHAIHFDLATLKKFISDIETEAQKINPETAMEDLGIRFYYAAYPKAADWDIMANTLIGKECAEKHTLVMVPTIKRAGKNGESECCDFSPVNSGSYDNDEILARTTGPVLQGDLISQNHGTLSPPTTLTSELF